MEKRHELTQYESDFLEEGYRAECSCGWMSERVPSMDSATVEHQIHIRETQPAPSLTPKQEAAEEMYEVLKAIVPEGKDWWCPICKETLSGSRVTHSECCDTCGTYLGGMANPKWMRRAREVLAKAVS